jgi:hypothetical protein
MRTLGTARWGFGSEIGPPPSRTEVVVVSLLLLGLLAGALWGGRPYCLVDCHDYAGRKYCCPIAEEQP